MATLDTEVFFGDAKMSLKDAIAIIPGEDGWWKSGSQDDFARLANELLENGFSAERTLYFLCEAYMAVADCYGG